MSKCRPCKQTYDREYYGRKKAHIAPKKDANTKRYRARNRKWLIEYLQTHPCVDCGESDIVVLDFDHVRGTKIMCVSEMAVKRTASLKNVQDEVAKCEVRCANDHRRITNKRRMALLDMV